MDKPYSIRLLKGKEIQRHLPNVANLRLRVFKEYPYLLDGDLKEALEYLSLYATAKSSLLVTATSNNELVGTVAGVPLNATAAIIQKTFVDNHQNLEQWFYIDEIVIAPQWRNRGLSRVFLHALEDHAKESGYRFTTFCVIRRPPTHPLRPRGFVPLNESFAESGYERLPDLALELNWVDIGDGRPSAKKMDFWYKDLTVKKD